MTTSERPNVTSSPAIGGPPSTRSISRRWRTHPRAKSASAESGSASRGWRPKAV